MARRGITTTTQFDLAEQQALGKRIGLQLGDAVRVSDDWNDFGIYPKRGRDLVVAHFTGFSVDRDVWVAVVYPDDPRVAKKRFPIYENTMPIYTHWQRPDGTGPKKAPSRRRKV